MNQYQCLTRVNNPGNDEYRRRPNQEPRRRTTESILCCANNQTDEDNQLRCGEQWTKYPSKPEQYGSRTICHYLCLSGSRTLSFEDWQLACWLYKLEHLTKMSVIIYLSSFIEVYKFVNQNDLICYFLYTRLSYFCLTNSSPLLPICTQRRREQQVQMLKRTPQLSLKRETHFRTH